jgi:acetyl-CoA synthetase
MGRPLPGYEIALLDGEGGIAEDEGEICLRLGEHRPVGLTDGYADDGRKTSEAMRGGYYHTGDIASRDEEGYLTFVGRADDVFKASDYRISPFELESVLVEHAAVAEAAVVPSPDAIRSSVPKAFVALAPGFAPTKEVAAEILSYCHERLAAYKRIRRIEFCELPKTISGKIRRVELRREEERRRAAGERVEREFFEGEL